METQCPNCQTVFELADEDLNRADGKVRCGECTTVFDARDHLLDDPPDDPQEDNPAFAETGVGWVLLPADQAVPETDKDGARYLSSAADEGWQQLGQPQDSFASNTDTDEPLRFDDNSPLPEDNLRLVETMAHETTPVVFKLVDSKTVDSDDRPAAAIEQDTSVDTDTSDPADPEARIASYAGDDENDDWAILLAEIDKSTGSSDDQPQPEAQDPAPEDLADTASANQESGDEPLANPITGATSAMSPDAAVDDVAASDNTQQLPAAGSSGDSVDAEIDAGLLAALGGDSDDPDSASDFFDDVLAELPDRSSVDMPTVSLDEAMAADTASAPNSQADADDDEPDDDDEEVDSSGIFVQENVLPDEDELADVLPHADAEASIVESIDNEHFVDTGVSDVADVADTPGWLSEVEQDPVTTRRHKIAVAALIALGVLQFAHFERHALATKPALNPWYQKVYGEALLPAWDATRMCFEQRDAMAENDRMQIVGLIANRGERAQPYPLLHVTLSGRFDKGDGDQTLAHAVLTPADYLRDSVAGQWVGPGVRFEARVDFPDDQQQTTGYDLEVCYQGPDATLVCNGPC